MLNANLSIGGTNADINFAGQLSGSGSLIKNGTGFITLSGSNLHTGETRIGNSIINLQHANALGNSQLVSNNGQLRISDGTVLSALRIAGDIRIQTDVRTLGSQTYDGNLVIDPLIGRKITISSDANSIIFNGLIDGNALVNTAKSQIASVSRDLVINAAKGQVVIGDGIGSINILGKLDVIANRITIKGDVYTFLEQKYSGDVTISDNGRVGFLSSIFMQNTRPVKKFSISSNIKTRTFVSMDPLIEFNGKVDGESRDLYTILVASIFSGYPTADQKPIVTFNDFVGSINPFYSINIQTIQKIQFADNLSPILKTDGKINIKGGIQTTADQNYSTDQMNLLTDSKTLTTTFKSNQFKNINFDVTQLGGQFNITGSTQLMIDGDTNFDGTGIGLLGVRGPVIDARNAQRAAAAGAASGGNLDAALKINKLLYLEQNKLTIGSVTTSADNLNQSTQSGPEQEKCETGSSQLACEK